MEEKSTSVVVAARPVGEPAVPAVSPTTRRSRFMWFLPVVLFVGAAATRFYAINSQSLWYDEGVSAGMVGQGPLAIIRQAAADFHPPLYYLLLAAWARLFGDSVIALRGLSACAGILLVLLTWRLASDLFGSKPGWYAATWATVAPLGIAYSQELRMYMPVAACVALAAYLALRWLDVGAGGPSLLTLPTSQTGCPPGAKAPILGERNATGSTAASLDHDCATRVGVSHQLLASGSPPGLGERWRSQRGGLPPRGQSGSSSVASAALLAAYTLAATVALYLQYVSALGLAAVGVYGLFRARGRSLWYWLVANGVALLLFAPWLPTFHRQLTVGHTATTAQTTAGHVLSSAAGSLLVGADGLPVWNRLAVVVLTFFVLLGLWRSLADGKRGSLPCLLVIIPLLGVTGYAAWKSVYEVRYILVALPGVAILGGLGIHSFALGGSAFLQRRMRGGFRPLALGLGATALVVAASGAADIRYYQAPLHPHDNYRGLAATIVKQGKAGDAVLLYPPGQSGVFDYYYRGPDPVVGLPALRPPDATAVTTQLAALLQAHPRLWVVDYGANEADPTGIVPTWLSQHAFLAGHQWFGSPQLLLYVAASAPSTTTDAAIRFTNGAELQSYAVSPRVAVPGGAVEITLNWLDQARISKRYTVFTHVLDATDHVVAQHDGEPAGGTRPTTDWQPGEVVHDMHGIVLPTTLPSGTYTIEVGMYLPQGNTRASILNSQGQAGADHVVLGALVVGENSAR